MSLHTLGIAFYESIRGVILDPIGLSALTYIATVLAALALYALISAIPARTPRPPTDQPPTGVRVGLPAPPLGSARQSKNSDAGVA